MWNLNDVIKIKYRNDYTFFIEFDDGEKGDINFDQFLKRGSVFKPLRNKQLFRKAKIEGGTIAWPNGADIAPETLYEQLKQLTKR